MADHAVVTHIESQLYKSRWWEPYGFLEEQREFHCGTSVSNAKR